MKNLFCAQTRTSHQAATFATLSLVAAVSLGSGISSAQELQVKNREGMTYAGIMATALNQRTVGDVTTEATWSQMAGLVLGTHINDMFHTEFRAGMGLNSGKTGALELDIDYFASWYLGLSYPLTNRISGYAQFGFSHLQGEAKLGNTDGDNAQFRDIEGDFPDSSFSVSWLGGLEYRAAEDGYVFLEGGKLFEDTVTEVNAFQFSLGYKHEF